MALQTPRIQSWPFRKTPARLQALFPEGKEMDWVASVPAPLADITESHFLRLRQLHPVSSVRLADGRVVYCGAPRESITLIADQNAKPNVVTPFDDRERRNGTRVPLACTVRYEIGSSTHKKTGVGRTIDMSSSGVLFTTQSLLRTNTRVALHVAWPIRLEGDLPVELFAEGKVVRTEPLRAAIKYDQIAFRVAT